jgi:beta-galactosidase
LPPDGRIPFQSKQDRARDYEWHLFWRTYYGDYLKMLTKMARDRGVTVPFYHNLPGWIYGHGYEFPVNITMYEELFGDKSDILFGVDHIPEFFSYRNMHDDRIINDITAAMQGDKPLFAAEFQCGSREYHVVTSPREMELFYKASVINGLTGWNYYMFSQGKNPRQRGYSGDTFYWFTPLTADGEKTSAFPLVQRMNRILQASEELIVNSQRKAEVCVLFYPPYYATELERPEEGNSGLHFNYASIRRPAYFDGLLKALQVLDVDYDMADLSQATAASLGRYKQVWAFSTDEMDASPQQVLVDYARNGGQLVIFPNLPDREMNQQACTILRDSIPMYPSGYETIDSPLIDLFGLEDIKCANPQAVFDIENLAGAEVIARTIRGNVCGFMKSLGKGEVVHLGTWLGYDTEGHKPAYEALLKTSGARLRNASSTNGFVNVRERFTDEGRGMLFIGNYYNEAQKANISYAHPENGETISMPYSGEELLWPPLYAVLTPLCIFISERLKILHATSDILDIKKQNGAIEITLFGDRDLAGEMVLEGDEIISIGSASLNDEAVNMVRDSDRVVLTYHHELRKEMVLSLKMV